MLKNSIANPDNYCHDVYQRRVNRWTILIETLIILLAIFLSIEVPETSAGYETAYRLLHMARWAIAAFSAFVAWSVVLLAVYGIHQWLKGK